MRGEDITDKENEIIDETIKIVDTLILDFSDQARDAAKAIRNKVDVWENVRVIRNQIELLDIHDLIRLLRKGRQDKNKIKDQGAVVFIGLSKAGKTTTITSLLGYPMVLTRINGLKTIQSSVPLKKDHQNLVNLPTAKSITRYPSYIKIDPKYLEGI